MKSACYYDYKVIYVPIRVNIMELVTYAIKIMTKLETIANGIDFFGVAASSPVVAIISKPIKA